MTEHKSKGSSFRWVELAVGTIILLVLGSLYAWSTYRGLLVEEFGWMISSWQFTFAVSMLTFCLAVLVSGIISGNTGRKVPAVASAVLMFAGLFLSSMISSLPALNLLSLIHISEPTRLPSISYAVFSLEQKRSTKAIKRVPAITSFAYAPCIEQRIF